MKSEKYISVRENVTGVSFANLGLFTGFGSGIINAVYSLILLDIFKSSELVGIYSSVYYAVGLVIALFFGEVMRFFSKAKIFYASLWTIFICYVMLSFSIKPATFITLDFFSQIPLVFVGALIPLFMADFGGKNGMSQLNGRYIFWQNAGALLAPIIAIYLAGLYGNRFAFFASGLMYLFALMLFKRYKIVQEDKKIRKINPRKTIKSICRTIKSYFSFYDLRKAYFVNFGYSAMRALRLLYMPIAIIESGFSKDTLGLVLTLGVIPYIFLSEPIGRIAKKHGPNAMRSLLVLGFVSFAVFSFGLFISSGYTMLAFFILIQVSGAIQSALKDLLFFNKVNNSDRSRFLGIFSTSGSLPSFIAPLAGAVFISVLGGTSAVWILASIIGICTTFVLLSKPKNSIKVLKK
jgi:MFS family permease